MLSGLERVTLTKLAHSRTSAAQTIQRWARGPSNS